MGAHYRYVKIAVLVIAWSGVLLVATYWSHTPLMFGQHRWDHLMLLGLLVSIAAMAEHLADAIVIYWTKQSSITKVDRQREWGMRRVRLRVNEITIFAMGLARTLSNPPSYVMNIVISCKRVARGLMSSESHP